MPDKPAKSSPAKPSPAKASSAKSSADSPNAAKGVAKARLRKAAKPKPAGKNAGSKSGGSKGGKKQRAKDAGPAAAPPVVSADAPATMPRKPGRSAMRRPPRQTFLVAATLPDPDGAPRLRVYAAVVRGPAEALAAVRALLGPEVAVELTGKLSNRMAKALGLKPDEIRPV